MPKLRSVAIGAGPGYTSILSSISAHYVKIYADGDRNAAALNYKLPGDNFTTVYTTDATEGDPIELRGPGRQGLIGVPAGLGSSSALATRLADVKFADNVARNVIVLEYETSDDVIPVQYEPFVDVAFNAADFSTGSAMTWTVTSGQLKVFRYRVIGKKMEMYIDIAGSTIGGTLNNTTRIKIPGGYIAKNNCNFTLFGTNNTIWEAQGAFVAAGSNQIGINRVGIANWAAGGFSIGGFFQFEIQ